MATEDIMGHAAYIDMFKVEDLDNFRAAEAPAEEA
jgi:hypothetical protein